MARLYSRLMTSRHHLRKNSGIFVAVAVGVFLLAVFFLFRGHSAGPQQAAASEAPPVANTDTNMVAESPAETAPPPVVETASDTGTVPSPLSAQPTEVPLSVTAITAPQDSTVDAALADALGQFRAQPTEIIHVRDKLNQLLQGPGTPEQKQTVKDELAKLSKDWLFGPAAFPGDMLCDTYTVRRGDLLDILGRRMKVPYEILMRVNNIARARDLQAGRTLKMIHGPFHCKIYRSKFTLDLYLQDVYVRSFKVGLGAPGSETPTGLWRVKEGGKLIQPPWYDKRTNRTYKASDPDYPLGTRWIALDGIDGDARGRTGFAIHGTKDPDQIGTAASQGCIRMYNNDVELMYSLLVPMYSQVEVVD